MGWGIVEGGRGMRVKGKIYSRGVCERVFARKSGMVK